MARDDVNALGEGNFNGNHSAGAVQMEEPPPPSDEHAPGGESVAGGTRPGANGAGRAGGGEASPPVLPWAALDVYQALTEEAPDPPWLLLHPTLYGKPCPPLSGNGMLPRGVVAMLVSDGGVGKSMALLALAVCVITGRPWLGRYQIPPEARLGKVLVLLAEEHREEAHRRLRSIAKAFDLNEEERRALAAQLVVLPLARHLISLSTDSSGALSAEFLQLRAWMAANAGPAGWSLIVLDPFSRLAPPDAEVENAVATKTIQAAETLIGVPGNPAVFISHHVSASSIGDGRQLRGRGVTGIKNGARWEGTLREDDKTGDVFFRQSKSNCSAPMREEIRLVRDHAGQLRAATEEEEEARSQRQAVAKGAPQAEKEAKDEERIAGLQGEYVRALQEARELPKSRRELTDLITGKEKLKAAAVSRLLARGQVLRPKKGHSEFYRLPPTGPTQADLDLPPPNGRRDLQ